MANPKNQASWFPVEGTENRPNTNSSSQHVNPFTFFSQVRESARAAVTATEANQQALTRLDGEAADVFRDLP